MSEETKDGVDLTREVTIQGTRYVWERHTSGAYIVDLMMLQGDSEMLAASGALVLAFPRFARAAKFKRNLPDAAARLYDYLVSKGWDIKDIMTAGMHAFVWLSKQLPPTSGSDEVVEAKDFSEAGQDGTPGE